jgi:hypothetical protein
MKKIIISALAAGMFLAIISSTAVNAQKHVKTRKQYIEAYMPHEPLCQKPGLPGNVPPSAIDINTSKKKTPPVYKPRELPVQSVSKKKPKMLNM